MVHVEGDEGRGRGRTERFVMLVGVGKVGLGELEVMMYADRSERENKMGTTTLVGRVCLAAGLTVAIVLEQHMIFVLLR